MNKIQLAALVSYLTNLTGHCFHEHNVEEIDRFAQNGLPLPAPVYADHKDVDALLSSMFYGRKIDAIKAYRQLTGRGLKESKDAVENFWHPAERPF